MAISTDEERFNGKVGFNKAPATTPVNTYTQTYSTADRTTANMTATAVATTAATSSTPFGYAEAQANAIVTALNALITDVTELKKDLNGVIDDLQALGLIA